MTNWTLRKSCIFDTCLLVYLQVYFIFTFIFYRHLFSMHEIFNFLIFNFNFSKVWFTLMYIKQCKLILLFKIIIVQI